MKYDLVAIGDITTDAFITLENARVNCDINDENCQLCINFGDKVPYESVVEVRAVGNSPNAVTSAHRLGLSTALVTNLGNDRNGDDCIEALKKEGIDTEFVQIHEGKTTNYHYVLRYEAERTILIKHEEYPYELPEFQEAPTWIYLSSLGDTSLPFHSTVAAYLDANPKVLLAFQPGTYQMKLGAENLKDIYSRTELTICNVSEANRILNLNTDKIPELLQKMHALGPKQVIITDGPKGAYASNDSGQWFVPMYPDPAPPVDRTGAGDAAASTTAAYLARGLPIQEALMRGVINSMSVVQHIGAQKGLLTTEKIDEWLEKAPSDFKATPLP